MCPVACEQIQGDTRTIKLLDQRCHHRRTRAYQRRRGVRLDPVELGIERDEGGSHLVFVVPIRRAYRGLDPKDPLAEHVALVPFDVRPSQAILLDVPVV
jgi:hypothetical protein